MSRINISINFITAIILLTFSIKALHLSYSIQYQYHNHQQLEQQTDNLVKSNPLFVKKTCNITDRYKYLQIGNRSAPLSAIIICNIHAREIITAEICLNWLNQYANTNLTHQFFIQIFYQANANRETFINNQDGCVRKNQNSIFSFITDVDSNRNFPTDFNHYHVDQNSEIYGGEYPISQPLTICLNGLIQQRKPDVFLDFHSGMDNYAFYQQGVNNLKEFSIVKEINNEVCNNSLTMTSLTLSGQAINGHIFADLKVRLQVPYSILFQTYLNNVDNCFLMFNPIEPEKQQLIDKYTRVMNTFLDKVAQIQNSQV